MYCISVSAARLTPDLSLISPFGSNWKKLGAVSSPINSKDTVLNGSYNRQKIELSNKQNRVIANGINSTVFVSQH